MLKTKLVAVAIVASSAPLASAQITDEDDPVFGVGTITRDAMQDLDFLDVTLSTNRSYDDVQAQFGVGGDFEGWRHATEQEVLNLVNNFGFLPIAVPGGAGFGSPLDDLVLLLGETHASGSTFGVTGTDLGASELRRVDLVTDIENSSGYAAWPSVSSTEQDAALGHWLVRQVPAPSGVASFGIVVLACSRRRR